jgi:glycine hydroxymethyltransferase
MSYLKNYFRKVPEGLRSSFAIAYAASLDSVATVDPLIAQKIVDELRDQRSYLKLIASENFCSLPVQLSMGNLLTDKYSEGISGHRFYAGCGNIDVIESKANDLAKELFQADHAYVQPHSGCDANLVAFWAVLVQRVQSKEVERLGKKTLDELSPQEYEEVRQLLVNQKVLGMALGSGGHLTHGYRHNISSKMMKASSYDINPKTGLLDYSMIERQVRQEKPLILIAGYSAYPRLIDFAKMREIADTVGAVLLVDMAHFSGLVAGKAMSGNYDPVPFAHIVTSTTHKTLRGPRGGLVLCQKEFKEAVDKGCPLVLGGPLPQVIAAKALAFQEALRPEFRSYAKKVISNAQALAESLAQNNVRVITSGTDNHLVVMDVASSFNLNGRQAESLLWEAHLTVNRNAIPFDVNGPWYTSGIRIGSAAITTLGMGFSEMKEIGSIIFDLLSQARPVIDEKTKAPSKAKAYVPKELMAVCQQRVADVLKDFPLYPELIIDEN